MDGMRFVSSWRSGGVERSVTTSGPNCVRADFTESDWEAYWRAVDVAIDLHSRAVKMFATFYPKDGV